MRDDLALLAQYISTNMYQMQVSRRLGGGFQSSFLERVKSEASSKL